jgi:hypothetical protein
MSTTCYSLEMQIVVLIGPYKSVMRYAAPLSRSGSLSATVVGELAQHPAMMQVLYRWLQCF